MSAELFFVLWGAAAIPIVCGIRWWEKRQERMGQSRFDAMQAFMPPPKAAGSKHTRVANRDFFKTDEWGD